jgi:hypothetical protein
VSDQQKPQDRAPSSGAGDAARTQQIPRLDRDGKPVGGGKDAAQGGANRRPAGPARPASGRGRPTGSTSGSGSPAKPAASKPSTDGPSTAKKAAPSPAGRPDPAKKSAPAKKGAAAREKTPTAADYAGTTSQSPDSTAVIPAVKDEPKAPAAPASPAAASASGRQARLRLTHVEPWSVTRLAFVVSVALMIVSVVAVTIFWVVLDLTGIWDQLNGTVSNVLSDSAGSFDLTDYLGLGRLVGLTLIFSAVNVVLMTAIATIAAHLYNLAAQLLGGIEVTFTDH